MNFDHVQSNQSISQVELIHVTTSLFMLDVVVIASYSEYTETRNVEQETIFLASLTVFSLATRLGRPILSFSFGVDHHCRT